MLCLAAGTSAAVLANVWCPTMSWHPAHPAVVPAPSSTAAGATSTSCHTADLPTPCRRTSAVVGLGDASAAAPPAAAVLHVLLEQLRLLLAPL